LDSSLTLFHVDAQKNLSEAKNYDFSLISERIIFLGFVPVVYFLCGHFKHCLGDHLLHIWPSAAGCLSVCLSVGGRACTRRRRTCWPYMCSVLSLAPFLSFKGGIEEGRGGEKKINETFLLFILYRPSPFL
jgi:hypothetical protein